jgi:prepilin-type N-terminal cleavage/methylation domain-containing protein
MKNKKGFSLVELLVVMAILALLVSGSTAGWNYISYANTSKCAKEINTTIKKVRLQAMSRTNKPYIFLYEKDEAYYLLVTTDAVFPLNPAGSKVANGKVDIYTDDGSGETKISSANPMKFSFLKSTGGFQFDASTTYKKIIVKGASTYEIELYETTGKTKLE